MPQTSSFVIANDAGAALRARINEVIAALQSTSAGASAPSATVAGMLWVDTSVSPPVLRRRSAIEPMIGHMKNDGRLTRCPLKGTDGDAIFAVLCGCGHNIRMILRHLRLTLCQLIWVITRLRQSVSVPMAPA